MSKTENKNETVTASSQAALVVDSLRDIWIMWDFDGRYSFLENIFDVLWNEEGASGERQLAELEKTEALTEWDGAPLAPGFKPAVIQISIGMVACAFAVQALKAKKGSPAAWEYVCEANRFLGILQGYMSGRSVDGRSAFSRKGAIAKNEPMAKLQRWVHERYRAGVWPSKHKASFDIAPEAVLKAADFNARLSAQRAQKTVYDWLRGKNAEVD